MKKRILIFLCISLTLSYFTSCGNNNNTPKATETMDSGKVEIFCDSSYKFAMDSVFQMYRQRYQKVDLTVQYVNARNATAHLLSGKTRLAIVGRNYLPDEDSLMKAYNVKPYYKMDIANDGLIFFVKPDFPLDTLNTDILQNYFTGDKQLTQLLGHSKVQNPEFVIAEQNSSEYGNFTDLVCKNKPITKKMVLLPNTDSVLKYIDEHPTSIGIAYLSQVQGKFYKILRIGYRDSAGTYIPATKPPHQSYIVMGEYPYTTLLRLYLLEDKKNLPFWLGTFCEKEGVVVQYYQKMRLVPSFATYTLDDERR